MRRRRGAGQVVLVVGVDAIKKRITFHRYDESGAVSAVEEVRQCPAYSVLSIERLP